MRYSVDPLSLRRGEPPVQPCNVMDACARIRGVPIKSRATMKKEVCCWLQFFFYYNISVVLFFVWVSCSFRQALYLFDQTIREGSNPCLKSLLKHKKELCNVVVELHNKESQCLSEVRIIHTPSCISDFHVGVFLRAWNYKGSILLCPYYALFEHLSILQSVMLPFEKVDKVLNIKVCDKLGHE